MKNKQQLYNCRQLHIQKVPNVGTLLAALKQGRLDIQEFTKPWENDKFIQKIDWKT
jgi:hypothetical protein